MTYKNYKIEADAEEVRIFGNLTITEAFDFLSYYEKEGFVSLLSCSGDECLRICKTDFNKDEEMIDGAFCTLEELLSLKQENIRLKKELVEQEGLLKQIVKSYTKPEKQKTVADIDAEKKEKYKTSFQTFKDFKVGDRVQIICACQDFHFFNDDLATVVEIYEEDHLCIKVEFDKPREGYSLNGQTTSQMTHFFFDASDLFKI